MRRSELRPVIGFAFQIFIVVILVLTTLQAQEVSPANLTWQNVASRYSSFREIKPVLLNNGDRSVFLSRLYPNTDARLQRLSEATGDWESGEWAATCGMVAKATVPIEVKPRAERSIGVYWPLSTDDWDDPKHFVIARSRDERPIEGRYRFVLRYSLAPWTLIQAPGTIYEIISPEFVVQP